MSRRASIDSKLVESAVELLKKHPTLSAAQMMHLAGFSEEERSNPSLQRLICRHLPGNSKKKFNAMIASPADITSISVDDRQSNIASTAVSPLTDPSVSTHSSSLKTKINRLNSKQKQDKWGEDISVKSQYKMSHKAATLLYADERQKGNEGMSVRKIEEKIKSRFKGVGPSASTIHHYVVNLGLVGASKRLSFNIA
jgi:hypothetical protein